MKPYSEDLRVRVVAARQDGHSAQEIAKLFQLSKRTVERYCAQRARTGHVRPKQMGGYRRSRLAEHGATLQSWVETKKDLTLAELQARCRKELRVKLGVNALWHQLQKLGLNFKKKRCTPPSRSALEVRVARQRWRAAQPQWESARLLFLDETGLNTKLGRLYGRALGGSRCVGRHPHGHWRTSTLVVGLRCEGLVAPLLLDGPMDGALFLAYLRQMLAAEWQPGDRVICDNLASHRVAGVEEAIKERGAILQSLPP